VLNLWSGTRHCGPHIHAIHFFYSFGAFVAPLAAGPFLSEKNDFDDDPGEDDDVEDTRITTLYPIIGVVTMVVSYGYWHYGGREIKW